MIENSDFSVSLVLLHRLDTLGFNAGEPESGFVLYSAVAPASIVISSLSRKHQDH